MSNKAYEEGRIAFALHGKCAENPYKSLSSEWYSFYEGKEDAKHEYVHHTLGVGKFLEALERLCKEYGVSVSSGCGCCGAGGYITDSRGDGFEFEF